MAKNVKRIAKKLGASVVERLPDVGGGTVGAMRMAKLLQERSQAGRATDTKYFHRIAAFQNEATNERLT